MEQSNCRNCNKLYFKKYNNHLDCNYKCTIEYRNYLRNKEKTCGICDTKFKSMTNTLTCSDKCKKDLKNEKRNKRRKETRDKLDLLVYTTKCSKCGESFNHSRVKKYKYCAPCKKEVIKIQRKQSKIKVCLMVHIKWVCLVLFRCHSIRYCL